MFLQAYKMKNEFVYENYEYVYENEFMVMIIVCNYT